MKYASVSKVNQKDFSFIRKSKQGYKEPVMGKWDQSVARLDSRPQKVSGDQHLLTMVCLLAGAEDEPNLGRCEEGRI